MPVGIADLFNLAQVDHTRSTPTRRDGRLYSFAAAGLIAVVALFNVAYLVADCPLELAPDEAHYWDWSRQLDWCYYSKGPLVAWVIRASRELLGELSVALVGNEMLALRLPAVVCQALLLMAVFVLARRTLRSSGLGLAAVVVGVSLPPVAALGVVMTIDPIFLACWAWAAVFVHAALFRASPKAWIAAGAVTAIGVLAKHTMLLFPASVAAYLILAPHGRIQFRKSGFWIFCGMSLVGMLPIAYWNWLHDGVGLRHLYSHVTGSGATIRPAPGPFGIFDYLGGQFALLAGFWLVALVAAAWRGRPGQAKRREFAYLWWLTVPLWLFFAAASVRAKSQPNWPAPAYISGLVLALSWVAEHWANPRHRRWLAGGIAVATLIGIIATICAHYPGPMRSMMASLLSAPTADNLTPIRKLDPTARLAGWRTLAAEVDRLRDRVIGEEGQDPVLAGMTWTIPGELGFYCRGNPHAYTFGVAIADRHSQYDIWRPNPLADAQVFAGRTFLYVGERMPGMERVFDRMEPPVEVIASDGGVPVAAWKIWVCRGFHGFPDGENRRANSGY